MSEHIVENNPKKEFIFALGGVGLFLAIVLLVGVSGFLRPAGEHITAEPEEAAAAEAAPAASAAAPATDTAEAAPAADADAIGAGETTEATNDVPADATVTPTEDTSGAVVASEAGTATTSGSVNQAAVQDSKPAAEIANVESGKPDSIDK